MTGRDLFLATAEEESDQVDQLVAFVAWSLSSQGNQARTISGKLAAVQYMHRVEKRLELPTGASRINRALKGVEKIHVEAGHRPRMRRPVSWETLLGGQPLTVSWGPGGRVLWLCLALSYFLLARSEEIFCFLGIRDSPRTLLTAKRRNVPRRGG